MKPIENFDDDPDRVQLPEPYESDPIGHGHD